jgi:hypothetical protein
MIGGMLVGNFLYLREYFSIGSISMFLNIYIYMMSNSCLQTSLRTRVFFLRLDIFLRDLFFKTILVLNFNMT